MFALSLWCKCFSHCYNLKLTHTHKQQSRDLRSYKHARDTKELESLPFNVSVGQKPVDKIHCKVKCIWNQLVVVRNLIKTTQFTIYSEILEKYYQFVLNFL